MKYPIPKPRPGMPVQTMGAPVQNARAQSPQMGFMERLSEASPALFKLGAGLLGGRTGAEQFALGAEAFGEGIQDIKDRREANGRKNKTVAWLKQNHPEFADLVDNGVMTGTEAFKLATSQKAEQPAKFDAYGFPRTGAISQKIRAFEAQGISTDKAMGLATGRYTVSVNPQTGERVIVDVATGQLTPLTQPDYAQPNQAQLQEQQSVQAIPQQTGLYQQADNATGVGSTLGNASSNTIGQIPGAIGDVASFPDTVKAGQDFDLFKRDLIRSLSLNPRFPVAEMRRIEDLLPRGPLTAPDTLKQALTSLDAELARIESELSVSVNNPNTPIQLRQQDATTLRGVQAARQRMAVPQHGGVNPAPSAIQGGTDLKSKYGLE